MARVVANRAHERGHHPGIAKRSALPHRDDLAGPHVAATVDRRIGLVAEFAHGTALRILSDEALLGDRYRRGQPASLLPFRRDDARLGAHSVRNAHRDHEGGKRGATRGLGDVGPLERDPDIGSALDRRAVEPGGGRGDLERDAAGVLGGRAVRRPRGGSAARGEHEETDRYREEPSRGEMDERISFRE